MKIALLSFEYPTETGFGGIGTYTWFHARALARLGHEVHVLAGALSSCSLRREDHDDVVVFRHRVEPPLGEFDKWLDRNSMWWTKNRIRNAFSMKNGLTRLLDREAYDIVEAPECGGEGALLGPDFPIPTLIKFHSPAALIMGLYDQPCLDQVLCASFENRHIFHARGYTACSRYLAEEVSRRLPVSHSVDVVPNGIDVELFDAEVNTMDLRRLLGIPADRPIVLFSGRLERRKGIHVMKDVAASVLAERDAAFVFVGQDLFDYGRDQLEPCLARARRRGSYHFLGRREPADVRSCLRQTDIFVVPSLWENCPYSCLEAMAAGCAVVGSDAGGLVELLDHEKSGLVAPVENVQATVECVTRLLDDRRLRQRLAEAARRKIETYHTDVRIAARTLDCYQQAICR